MSKELQQKLYNYEVTPPASAWDKVAAALDESHLSDKFPASLYEYEVAAPKDAWQKIQAGLGEETQATSAVVRRMYAPLLRYAAAAVLVAAVAFGAFKVFDRKPGQEQMAGGEGNTPAVIQPQTEPTIIPETENVANLTQQLRDDAALEASKSLYASLDASDKKRISRVSEEYFLSPVMPISAADDLNPHHTYRALSVTEVESPVFLADYTAPDMADRYITLLTPEGNYIRISKKLAPIVCCVSGEENDADCNLQLKKWREKLARPDVGTSPGNFIELLNMISNFKENNP